MSVVETTVEFIVQAEEEPILVPPSIIGMPVAEQAEPITLSAPIKEAVLTWFVRQGQEQRPDVTLTDRVDIARRFWDPERRRGTPFELAAEYRLSRMSIYNIANRLAMLFQPRRPGPVAGLKQALAAAGPALGPPDPGPIWTRTESERLRGRLILTGLFPGGMPLRPLEELLGEVPGVGCSDSTIWRQVEQVGGQAAAILRGLNFRQVSAAGVIPVIDETFFDDFPVLFVVEPRSLVICDFHIPADKSRTAETWATFLLVLKEDRGLNIMGGMGDAATAYPPTFETLLGKADQLREDHFHTMRDLQKLARKLENGAYRAFKAEYKAVAQDKKKGTVETGQKLVNARAESRRLADLYDAYAVSASWVTDALQIVDLSSGEIRDRHTNAWLLEEARAAMAQLNHPEVVKMSQRLKDHHTPLLAYLNDLGAEFGHLQTELQAYLTAPDLAQVVLRAVARRWRLQHEVESNQRRNFRSALTSAQATVELWVAGDPFLEAWATHLHALLDGVLRTSSAVENINSIFKPLVHRKQHFANPDSAHNFVALFVLWHNMRVFKEGLRRSKSPFQILGIDLAETDWRTLLGYPPLS